MTTPRERRLLANLRACWGQRVEGWLEDPELARLFVLALFAETPEEREAAARRFLIAPRSVKGDGYGNGNDLMGGCRK
jgi:hypothetical protein